MDFVTLIIIILAVLCTALVCLVLYLFARIRRRSNVYKMDDEEARKSSNRRARRLRTEFYVEYDEIKFMEQVATGSFGEVYRARWRGTEVAVKKLFQQKRIDEELTNAFYSETLVLGKLRHPNVILFMGSVVDDQHLCIITEFMTKGSLHDVLRDPAEELSWKRILQIASGSARGMNYLHKFNPPIIHRDLKSRNLLVDEQYNVKVSDFGLSRFKLEEKDMTLVVGTIQWMAPEVIRDENFTEKADVYSFGIVLWELLSRDSPYRNLNHIEIATQVAYENFRPVVPEGTDEDYASLVTRCWAATPDERPTFDEVLDSLKSMQIKLEDLLTPKASTPLISAGIDNASGSINELVREETAKMESLELPSPAAATANGTTQRSRNITPASTRGDLPSPMRESSLRNQIDYLRQTTGSLMAGTTASVPSATSGSPPGATGSALPVIEPPGTVPQNAETPKGNWHINMKDVQLVEKVGVGSFGQVHRAVWRETVVAVKRLNKTEVSPLMLEEFLSETAMMCELRHPNVVLFMGASLDVPDICLVTEYMTRGNLYDIIHQKSLVLDWNLLIAMALDAARGMNYLHSMDPVIIHRDLKSSNLLVDDNWTVKVSDFGMSRFKTEDSTMTQVGTLKWTAPEVLRNERYTEKVDLYSFGIILWELFTRQDPYPNMSGMQAGLEVLKKGLRPPIPDDCPPLYAGLMARCWHAEPEARPSFSDSIAQLKTIEIELQSLSKPKPGFLNSPRKLLIRSSSLGSIRGRSGSTGNLPQPSAKQSVLGMFKSNSTLALTKKGPAGSAASVKSSNDNNESPRAPPTVSSPSRSQDIAPAPIPPSISQDSRLGELGHANVTSEPGSPTSVASASHPSIGVVPSSPSTAPMKLPANEGASSTQSSPVHQAQAAGKPAPAAAKDESGAGAIAVTEGTAEG